ncbi:Radial spoke head 14 like [Schistosoma japonicum]|nr:Radial spoke head 14 like [Schistosoma japonicum]
MKMAFSRISLNPPPNIDPTRATLAYGRLAIKRINRELKDIDILTRQRAVKALSDYLHDPEHIAEAINEGNHIIIESIIEILYIGVICSLSVLLKDPDISCRAYTTECFVIICQHAIGRTAALAHNILESFKPLTDFNQPDVIRLNIHKAIELLTTNLSGAEAIVKAGYIDLLVKCVEKEVDEIKAIVLDTLYHCFSFDSDEGLNSGGIPLFTKLLSHSNSEIRTRAAQNILRLCVNPRGKQEALDNETIPALIGLLNDQSEDVKASSTGALAFICTTNHGRYTTLNAGAIPLLLCLVDNNDNNNSRVRINALKISSHVNDTNAAVVKHTKIAISVITWKP